MAIVFDTPEISVVVTNFSGEVVMRCFVEEDSCETVRDFLLRHEDRLGGESPAPAEIMTLVNLDANAEVVEPFDHDKQIPEFSRRRYRRSRRRGLVLAQCSDDWVCAGRGARSAAVIGNSRRRFRFIDSSADGPLS